MSVEKSSAERRRRLLGRLFVAIFSIGCIIHLTHRDCARGAYLPQSGSGAVEVKPLNSPLFVESKYTEHMRSASLETFQATAYCDIGITKSGVPSRPGLVSADPKVIPLGSMIYVESPLKGGIYQVLDTGRLVKGKIIDIFIPDYDRCIQFGRRIVKVKVLRYGFHRKRGVPRNPVPALPDNSN